MRDIHPKWNVIASEEFKDHVQKGDGIIGPDIHINGVNTSRQFLTVLGAHPVDVGFAWFAGSTPAPKDGLLPVLDYPRDRLKPEVKALGRYAVLPVGNVQESRKVVGRHLNPIILYLKILGIEPVFLGKRDPVTAGKVSTTFADDILYQEGLDLREQTTVKEAACIMQHAEFTLGLDTGLLHLAALMKDSKVIFGYNITSIEHREPRRNHGRHVNVTLPTDELKCIGCQSKLKQVAGHTFDKCIYLDNACVDLLFKDEAKRWRDAIDQILAG
jgi:ADP-heptose:LPS heptosyltransferase